MGPMIAVIVRARALIARLRKYLEYLKKAQDLMRKLGAGQQQSPMRSSRPRASSGSSAGRVKIKLVRFELNRKGVRALLNSDGVAAAIRAVAERGAPPGTSVEMGRGPTRVEARIVDRRRDALDREAQTGHLSRALGRAART